MIFAKLRRRGKRFVQLGPRKSFHILENRIKTGCFNRYWKHIAIQKQANHSWGAVSKKLDLDSSFDKFFEGVSNKKISCLAELYPVESFDNEKIIKDADKFVNNTFDILGSGEQKFEKIPWHYDFRLKNQDKYADFTFDKDAFYKDIHIKSGKTKTFSKDIKIPWELSRCYHLLVLGQAYKLTGDEKYSIAFEKHVTSWIEENKFLLGANWVCAMEVGIRALNFTWAFLLFKDSKKITKTFWKNFTSSLYDHLFFLEHNWEVYDSRTSNHYLSDLIGYFYLCFFFSDSPVIKEKSRWCYQELLREFEKQIFEDGTDYEGSTNYHKLITEIYAHFYLLGREQSFPFSTFFVNKLSRMFDFIDLCSVEPGRLISIGDNDSGKILYYGVTPEMIKAFKSEQSKRRVLYKSFGLSIFKESNWHVSLRHHAYNESQPSGHFHNDVGSITLAYKGKDIIVDPGSYVYTPSEIWRNHMRSVIVHNGFFLDGLEPVPFDYSLFALEIPAQINKDSHFSVRHDLYGAFELRANRDLMFDKSSKELKITDWWSCIGACQRAYPQSCWNFTLAPDIETEKTEDGWLLKHNGDPLVLLSSEHLEFDERLAFVSYSYGDIQKSRVLRSMIPFELNKKSEIKIVGL